MTFDELISHYGSQAEAARALGLKQPSVHGWKEDGIPYLRQLDIERRTDGALKAEHEKPTKTKPRRQKEARA